VEATGPIAASSLSDFCSRGESLRDDDHFPELRALCEQALASSPEPELAAAAHRFLGAYWEDMGAFDKAEANYRKAIEIAPRGPGRTDEQAAWATLGLGECKRQRDLTQAGHRTALPFYQRVVEGWPGTEAARWAQVHIAQYYDGEKQWDRAEVEYLKALENPQPTRWMGRAFCALGKHFYKAGQQQYYGARQPQNARGLLRKAIAYHQKALQDYGACMGETLCADTHVGIALCCSLMGYDAAAEKAYRQVLKSYPGNKMCNDAHFGLACIATRHKRYDDAIAHYETILRGGARTHPGHAVYWQHYARWLMGQCYVYKGDHLQAVQEFKAVVESYPETKSASNSLHWIGSSLAHLQRYAEARAACEEMISRWPMTPEAAWAQFCIGQVYRQEGNLRAAMEAYQEVLDIYPDEPAFRSTREAAAEVLSQLRNNPN
jgi:tetratricopeptide (TPR) repeat protein